MVNVYQDISRVSWGYKPTYNLLQWPFQEPKLEVPTISKAHFSVLNFRGPPNFYGPKYDTNAAHLHFRILEFPFKGDRFCTHAAFLYACFSHFSH